MPKKIFIIGAGLSSGSLIRYLLDQAPKEDWQIVVGDMNLALAEAKIAKNPYGQAIFFDVHDSKICEEQISKTDLVVSLLPAFLHYKAAATALKFGKNFLTASYVSPEIKALDKEIQAKNLLFLNELGADPGIDHLSAMQIFDELKAKGAEILSFKSYTGGLIAPAYDNNPWNYKFTWNPLNVVLAGQGVAKYLQDSQPKYVPYHRLFSSLEKIQIDNYGDFEGYPNRDSLIYRELYGIENIPTILRGTLRRKGFCESWNVFVQLGMTDDSYPIDHSESLTYADFLRSFLPKSDMNLKDQLEKELHFSKQTISKLDWLGIFEPTKIGLEKASPAKILQHLLESKWKLAPKDKDLLVMQHIVEYRLENKNYQLFSTMTLEGNEQETAMSQAVGLPLAVGAHLLMKNQIQGKGVQIPNKRAIYEPILKKLVDFGISFAEKVLPMKS